MQLTINGSFPTNGASSPATFEGDGIASVARTGTGTYTVTLTDKYPSCIAVDATLQLGTADGSVATPGAIDVSSAKTMVIVTSNASGAATDIAAAASNRVNFQIVVRQSARKTSK